MPPPPIRFAGYDRLAISALFLANGLLVGSWVPKIPALMKRLVITESTAGLIVLALGLGSLAVMPLFGAMTARHGSARAVRLASWLALPTLLLISLAPNLPLVIIAVVIFGGLIGGMDVAMNANAVTVERARHRAIMSSCHGFWSVGGVIGAGLGGMAIARFGELGHAVLATVIYGLILVLAVPRILRDPPAPDVARSALRLPRSPLPYIIGFMALCCMIPEGAIIDWAAVYLQREMGASLSVAGWGYAACAATMAVMRFAGDVIRQKLGAVNTLRFGGMIAMAGLGIAGLADGPGMAIFGFGFAGLGIANMLPVMFSAAGNLPGLAQGVGLSIVTMMGYSGILLAPASIGYLAEHVSFAHIYLGLAVLLIIPLILARLAATADFTPAVSDE